MEDARGEDGIGFSGEKDFGHVFQAAGEINKLNWESCMKIKTSKIISVTVLLMSGFLGVAVAEMQSDTVSVEQGSGSGCVGTYYAVARMTNSSGAFWITPPQDTHTGTFTNASGSGYTSTLYVMRKIDQQPFCATGSVTFPATNSSYSLTLYVTSHAPPPTNNQPINLQVTWK